MKKNMIFIALGIVILAAAGMLLFFLFSGGQEKKENVPSDGSSVSLSKEEQRNLLLKAGMTEKQADCFLKEKEETILDSGAITDCIFRENKKDFYIVTDTNRGFSLTVSGGYSMLNQLTYTVRFQGDIIETLKDYNDVTVIENGVRVENYMPWTPKAILDAEKEIREQAEKLAEEWYNTTPCPAKRGSKDWLAIDRVTFVDKANVIGNGEGGYMGESVSIVDGQISIPCQGTAYPVVEYRDNEPTWKNFFIRGILEQRGEELKLVAIIFEARKGTNFSYEEKVFSFS